MIKRKEIEQIFHFYLLNILISLTLMILIIAVNDLPITRSLISLITVYTIVSAVIYGNLYNNYRKER